MKIVGTINIRFWYPLGIFFLTLFTTCNNSDVDPVPLIPVQDIIVSDNSNSGNTSDIEVNFTKPISTDNIREYRVFLVKSELLDDVNEENIEALTSDRYASALPGNVFPLQGIRFPVNTLDYHGKAVTIEDSYQVGVVSISMNPELYSNVLQYAEEEFQLTNNNIISDYSDEMQAGAGSLIIDGEGVLFMADYDVIALIANDTTMNHAVQRIDASGSVTEFTSPLKLLTGNAFDSNFNMFQSKYFNGDVIVINPGGGITEVNIPDIVLDKADGIYVDNNDNVYIADPSSGFIYRIPTGGTVESFSFVRNNPRGITGDDEGNLYVSHNHEEGFISKILPDGTVETIANLPTFVPPTYQLDFHMWLGYITFHEGFLYVAGTSTHQIFKVGLDGEVEIFAGSGERGIPRGDTRTANLNRPMGLVFSNDGSKLFISCSTDTTPQHTQYSRPSQVIKVELVETN